MLIAPTSRRTSTFPVELQTLMSEFWNGESGFTIRAAPESREDVQVYSHNPFDAEGGGVEYARVLLERPPSPALSYDFDYWNLAFHYQGRLSKWEVERGNERPEHVLGSWAVYHPTRRNNQYKTGKACHIYRAWAEDARGWRVWCRTRFAPGKLLVIMPEQFWRSAAYPVFVDPTIGYTSLGASVDTTNRFALANSYTAPSSGDANPGTAYYGGRVGTGTGTVYIGVYDFGDGDISGNNRLAVSSGITLNTTAQFQSAAITWTGIVSGTAYFIENYSNTIGVITRYDTTAGQTNQQTSTVSGAASPPDPHVARSGTAANWQSSAYVDYTAGGGSSGNPWYYYAQQ